MARQVGILQAHTVAAPALAQTLLQEAPDGRLNLGRRMRESLVAAPRPDGKRIEAQRLAFLPRGPAKGVHIALDRARDCVISDSQHVLDARSGLLKRSAIAQPHQEAIAGLLDPRDRTPFQVLRRSAVKSLPRKNRRLRPLSHNSW